MNPPLTWIIRQSQCDKATALSLFYLSEPGYYLKYEGDRAKVRRIHLDGFDFIDEVRRRYVEGFYRRSEIAFVVPYDQRTWRQPGADRDFPEVMRQSLGGRDVLAGTSRSYAGGLPVWLLKKLGIQVYE